MLMMRADFPGKPPKDARCHEEPDFEEGAPIEQEKEKKLRVPLHTDRKFIRLSICIFLAVLLIGGGAAYYLNTLPAPQQDAAAPAETPAPTPEPTPEVLPQATPEAAPTAAPTATPEPVIAVKAVLDEEVLFYAVSDAAVHSAMERVLQHFSETALGSKEGAALVSAEWAGIPELLPLDEGEEAASPLDEEGVIALLTAADSPLRANVTLRSSETVSVSGDTDESRTANLIKGMRAILDMGRNGSEEVISHILFVNGEPQESEEVERITLHEAHPLTILNGKGSVPDEDEEPGRHEGEEGPDAGDLEFVSPISKGKVISNFGGRKGAWHHGLDYSFKTGAEALASEAGTVIAAFDWGGYGFTVELDHGNGFTTRYCHLDNFYVSVGDTVEKGAPIGLCGSTGNVEEAHLHFELRVNGMAYNPREYID
ncbi:MAG: M23 family metallopeptidase [Clostridia bacterium]|nr:M23 family metallopeptidase [Clostridia bacterium]